MVRTLRSLFSFYFIIIFLYFTYSFIIIIKCITCFTFLIMISPLLGSGVWVGRLCWVGHGPVVFAAGGRPTTFDNSRAKA